MVLRVTKRYGKNSPNFSRSNQSSLQAKRCQNIYNKVQFKSPKHLQQTTLETLKHLQQSIFLNCLFRQKCINLLKPKVTQNVTISLGYFIFSKNHNEPPKVAQLAKNR
jgi:hypothetical protein